MGLSKQELKDLASRYVEPGSMLDFVSDGEVFCLLGRDLPTGAVLQEEEGWNFRGYGICLGYEIDTESKPVGKWIWMRFASLDTFPPAPQVLKLQPPHIVKGRFQNPERTREFRILRVGLTGEPRPDTTETIPQAAAEKRASKKAASSPKIVQFRRKK